MKFIVLGFTLLLAAWLTLTQWYAPKRIRQELGAVMEKCECQWEVGTISVSPFRPLVTLDLVTFSQGDPAITGVRAKVKQIAIYFSPRKLLSRLVHVTHIEIRAPDVVVEEGDKPSVETEEKQEPESAKYEVAKTTIHDGKFQYLSVHHGRRAPIHVQDIQAEIGAFGSTIPEQETKAEATGQLEKSGKFRLTITTPLYVEEKKVDVELRIKNQDLADLNPFFQNSEGVLLKGLLYDGHSSVSIRGRKLDAWTKSIYRGLDIRFRSNSERSGLTAFLSNLVKSVQLETTNVENELPEQVRGVSLVRKARESMVSFVIRGMKEAALRVATEG